jgi:hypothetical protein
VASLDSASVKHEQEESAKAIEDSCLFLLLSFLSASFGKHKNSCKHAKERKQERLHTSSFPSTSSSSSSSLYNSPKEKQKMAQKDNLCPRSPNAPLHHHHCSQAKSPIAATTHHVKLPHFHKKRLNHAHPSSPLL